MRNPKPSLPFGDPTKPHLLVLGSGWASMSLLNQIDTRHWNVTVVSPRNYFLFTPLLPSCTVGTLELRSIMCPIRFITGHKKRSVKFVEADVVDIDPQSRHITVKSRQESLELIDKATDASLPYDYLVVGVGAQNATFGIPGVGEHANFLKEIWHAKRIREKVMDCFETASFPGLHPNEVDRLLHFIVVGGGPTGIEYAAELRDFVEEDLVKWFPDVAKRVKITLIEAAPNVLASFDSSLQLYTEKHFQRENIVVRTSTAVREVKEREVIVLEKSKRVVEETHAIPYGILVWATGNGPRPLTSKLAQKLPHELQNQKRGLVVDDHLRVKGTDRIFAIGDCAATPYAATAQVATQQGGYLGRLLSKYGKEVENVVGCGKSVRDACEEVDRNSQEKGFAYTHRGSLAYIGTDRAIADLPGNARLAGFATFLFWRSFYLSSLFTLRNKSLVMFDWTKKILFGRDIARE
ncbi:FAD/NAD(P)-binding domain-containing protein [Gonapodya prolifera JEL478]|uniref:NADH:ubiquinone reductase (non-electrogenic) n=1 Tax=Gonapodya prolifera (strain JEL478) TaxID=1344416 RepID=A0A138ZXP6_GONPJ|nr:FAD/NAD(P)-binding domain-containing protein [Gonapodya prolifera JEL478]|eukprot:KXS09239.1 FAD/NAD(P)-binding domain-containing protein [Gonapodya prolifera JEL478]